MRLGGVSVRLMRVLVGLVGVLAGGGMVAVGMMLGGGVVGFGGVLVVLGCFFVCVVCHGISS